jgi:hypothetical protein
MKTKDTEQNPEAELLQTTTEPTTILSLTQQKMIEEEKRKLERAEKRRSQLKANVTGKQGRPKGSKNKLTLLREAVLEKAEHMVLSDWEEVVQTTLTLAKAGDTSCLKILWDRVIPSKRAIDPDSGDKTPTININISGLQVKSVMGEAIEDADYEEVDEDGYA